MTSLHATGAQSQKIVLLIGPLFLTISAPMNFTTFQLYWVSSSVYWLTTWPGCWAPGVISKQHILYFSLIMKTLLNPLLVTSGLYIELDNQDSWAHYTMSFPLAQGNSWVTSLPLLDNMNECIIFSSIDSTAPTPVSWLNLLNYFFHSLSISGTARISASTLGTFDHCCYDFSCT